MLPPLLAGSGQPSMTLVAAVSHTKGASVGAQEGTVAWVQHCSTGLQQLSPCTQVRVRVWVKGPGQGRVRGLLATG